MDKNHVLLERTGLQIVYGSMDIILLRTLVEVRSFIMLWSVCNRVTWWYLNHPPPPFSFRCGNQTSVKNLTCHEYWWNTAHLTFKQKSMCSLIDIKKNIYYQNGKISTCNNIEKMKYGIKRAFVNFSLITEHVAYI
jgi:hypothetical protein